MNGAKRKAKLEECRRLGFAQQSILSEMLKEQLLTQGEYDELSEKIIGAINGKLLTMVDGRVYGPVVGK